MDSPVVGSRQPMDNLKIEKNSESKKIFEKFDMFREVFSISVRDALSFSYLEHLMRVSTPLSELNEAVRLLPRSVSPKISQLAERREDILQEAIHCLDSLIVKEDVRQIKINLLNINYKWDGFRFNIEEFQEGIGELLPVSYTLTWKKKIFLLYTPNMTYIDGYDCFSGDVNIPIIPESMMKLMTKGFYQQVNTKGIQTEIDKKSRKSIQKNRKDSKNSDTFERSFQVEKNERSEKQDLSSSRIIDRSVNDASQLIARKISVVNNEIPERIFQEEEIIYEKNENYSDSGKESSEEEVKKPVVMKKPVEKTWERYEKKASDFQKERDQCGPGDCSLV